MATRSGFFNSVNRDRVYDASNFAEYFGSFISNGVFPNPSNSLQIYEKSNMTITVKPGKGWINGYFFVNDSDYDLTLATADGVLNRIDRIVLRLDNAKRQILIDVKKGVFASNPVAQNVQRDADMYEIALADVYVKAGATSISQINITDTRLSDALCGIVHGLIQQADMTTIFNQYLAWYQQFTNEKRLEFDDWFQSIKDQLSGDIVGNIMLLIEGLDGRVGTLEEQIVDTNSNLIDVAIELEMLKASSLTGVNANIMIETFQNLNDVELVNGIYDSTNKRLYI
ncbi:hypothetical protein [Rummeliibacillus sp. TYF005]|uniref:hypothetical protein n=1 Tax=Rummeliibacillus sp. TYF005 TaxID=2058214 RepID=UPI000F533A8F|nr:hypothetical protein [Rummeliibacillus sp. TYF005]